MNRFCGSILLLILLMITAGCGLLPGQAEKDIPDQEIPSSEIETYTSQMVAQGFEFCRDSYLELDVTQIHENPQFNFYNRVSASGKLDLDVISPDQGFGLETQVKIPLSGEGWAGICQFTSSGDLQLDLQARLFPGESDQPALLVYGNCHCAVTSKPPCGDFGMIPLEEKVFFTLPYQEGGSFERTWHSTSLGVSGSEVWTLHIPCEN